MLTLNSILADLSENRINEIVDANLAAGKSKKKKSKKSRKSKKSKKSGRGSNNNCCGCGCWGW